MTSHTPHRPVRAAHSSDEATPRKTPEKARFLIKRYRKDIQLSVVKIRSGFTDDEQDRPRLVARLDYPRVTGIWYRFNLFVIRFYDLDTHDPLFSAGTGRDNPVSTEDVVIKDTFAKRPAQLCRATDTSFGYAIKGSVPGSFVEKSFIFNMMVRVTSSRIAVRSRQMQSSV